MLKQEKGITLIALVVTIIILIILAAITIMAITGDHSITKTAGDAKILNIYNNVKEIQNLSVSSIRQTIMYEVAKDSTYDARETANVQKLAKLIVGDFGGQKAKEYEYAIIAGAEVDPAKKEEVNGVEQNLTEKTIYIKYTDTAIYSGKITEPTASPSTAPEPRYDTVIYSKIDVAAQSVSFEYDIEMKTPAPDKITWTKATTADVNSASPVPVTTPAS